MTVNHLFLLYEMKRKRERGREGRKRGKGILTFVKLFDKGSRGLLLMFLFDSSVTLSRAASNCHQNKTKRGRREASTQEEEARREREEREVREEGEELGYSKLLLYLVRTQ